MQIRKVTMKDAEALLSLYEDLWAIQRPLLSWLDV